MTKDEALRLALEALEVANSLVDGYYLPKEKAWVPEIEEAITAIKAALEAKDEPVGSFMTRLQAIDFLLKMRPQTEPTEKQIIATIDAYSALFGDMIESPTPTQRKPLTDEEIQGVVNNACLAGTLSWMGYKADDEGKYTIPVLSPSNYQFARAIEAAHGIKGEA